MNSKSHFLSSTFYLLLSILCLFLPSTFYFLFSAPPFVFAAKISLDAEIHEIAIDQQFQVDLLLNTEGDDINALEGKIVFPQELLEAQEIKDGNSIINFWIEKPKVESDNQIIFSGITPGGFQGKNGLIFSAIFQGRGNGEGVITIQGIRALKNDGLATLADVKVSDFQFLVSDQLSPTPIIQTEDTEPPETFRPEITRDKSMFDGKWFLVFATQDKASGIDHFEVREIRSKILNTSKWQVAESPYVLKDQKLHSYIHVKAIDKAGNERMVRLAPRYPLKWYKYPEIWVIIIVGVITTLLIVKKLWRKKRL